MAAGRSCVLVGFRIVVFINGGMTSITRCARPDAKPYIATACKQTIRKKRLVRRERNETSCGKKVAALTRSAPEPAASAPDPKWSYAMTVVAQQQPIAKRSRDMLPFCAAKSANHSSSSL
jgi:hypothetical protein